MDPATMMMLANALGAANKQGQSNTASAAQPLQAFTPEMLDRALQYIQSSGQQLNTLYGTPSYAPGGVSTTQASKLSAAEIKAREYAEYLVNKKGYTPDNAQRAAQAIVSDPKRRFTDDKEFKQYIKTGGSESLSLKGRKIKAATEFTPGGINASPESEAMRQAMQGLGMQSLQAASGLPFMYGAEEARALQTRQALANQAMNYLGQGFETSGLTANEQGNLDALKNKYLQDFGDLYKDTMRTTAGGLQSSGFASSNLANENLQRGAYDPQSRFLTNALAALAEKEQGLVAQRFGMQSQNLSNMLGAFGALGANQGIGSVLGGITNPAGAGLFTDPQSAQMAAMLQQQNIGNVQNQQAQMAGALQKPVTLVPEQPGFWGNLLSATAPYLGPVAQAVSKTASAPRYSV